MIEFLIFAGILFTMLLVLAKRRGAFARVGPDDTPGDGIAEHMDGLGIPESSRAGVMQAARHTGYGSGTNAGASPGGGPGGGGAGGGF